MMTRPLGKTGFSIAPLVFGGNVFGWTCDEKNSFAILDAFVDHGFDAIDTADVYSRWADGNQGGESETIIGRWLQARPGMRERVKIFSKVGADMGPDGQKGLSKAWIQKAVDHSLRRLNSDYIDLYFAHWPDPQTPLGGNPGSLPGPAAGGKNPRDRRVEPRRAAAVGGAGSSAPRAACRPGRCCSRNIISITAPPSKARSAISASARDWRGDLLQPGLRFFKPANTASRLTSRRASAAAASPNISIRAGCAFSILSKRLPGQHNAKPAEVALAWLMSREGVTAPIASATSVAQVESFARAAGLTLNAAQLARLEIASA
ncbi:putative aldo-keto reductase [Raoultella terrigena]|uniref:Putative aldo-keto reductase n=1 Tax=Raoultella terrigena TaxID=577 RepID=A0A4U9DEF6_RAOTE|nr:putative aldo-keto reductase [Raoultella terrigena]